MKVFELDENGQVKETAASTLKAAMDIVRENAKNEPLYADIIEVKSEYHECPYSNERGDNTLRNGQRYCKRKRVWCDGNGNQLCDEPFEVIERSEMCAKGSIFGNFYLQLTEENIEALRAGKVLFTRDEYGIFVKM